MPPHKELVKFSTGVLAVLAVIGAACQAIALPSSEIGKIAQDVTVLIDMDGAQLWGSGVIIYHEGSTYTVLTAKHVLVRPSSISQVETVDGKRYPLLAQTVKMLPGVDLAVLEFKSDRPYKIAKIANSDQASIGSVVYTSGFPAPGQTIHDREFRFTRGEIASRPTKAQADGYAMIYTNITRRGMSGGPVLNEDGQLVGIHGRADGDSVQNNNSGAVVTVKDVNLGIPINMFLTLAPKAGIQLNFKTPRSPAPATAPAPPSTASIPTAAPSTLESSGSPSYPSFLPSRPQPIRPSTSPQAPVCAGSSC
jgi:serine protease Do